MLRKRIELRRDSQLWIVPVGSTRFTGKPVLTSGFRQVAIGLGAAAVTFLVGQLIGVTIMG